MRIGIKNIPRTTKTPGRGPLYTVALLFGFVAVAGAVFLMGWVPNSTNSAEEPLLCGGLVNDAERSRCWEEFFRTATKNGEVPSALEQLVVLSQEDEVLSPDCHAYAHVIGEEGYVLFSGSRAFDLSPLVSICGYGFFHGFMETLLLTTGRMAEAQEFCRFLDSELSGRAGSGSSAACYHGIGHGFLDGSDPRLWGNPDSMVAEPLAFCARVSETALQEYVCAAGVFNSLEILSADEQYRLTEIQEDPYAFCRRQELEHQEACYTNMIIAVLRITDDDIGEAMAYIRRSMENQSEETVTGFTTEEMVILSLFAEFMRLHINDPDYASRGLGFCRSLSGALHLACIKGLSFGHMKYGTPQYAHEKFIAFCSSEALTASEQDACFRHVLKRISLWYDSVEAASVCRLVPDSFSQKYCTPRS